MSASTDPNVEVKLVALDSERVELYARTMDKAAAGIFRGSDDLSKHIGELLYVLAGASLVASKASAMLEQVGVAHEDAMRIVGELPLKLTHKPHVIRVAVEEEASDAKS